MRVHPSALAAIVVMAVPVAAHAQEAETLAHQRFLRGLHYHDAHQYEQALEEFRASYSLFASPNSRLYIARSLRDLGRLPDAAAEYDTTIAEAEERARSDTRYESTRVAAVEELRALERRIARVQVVVPDAPRWVRIRVGGRVTPRSALGLFLPVQPGSVEIDVEADGRVTEHRVITVAAGQRSTIEVPLRMAEAGAPAADRGATVAVSDHPGSILPTVGLVTAGVGVLGFAGFAVFGLWANATFNDVARACGTSVCDASQEPALDRGRTLQTLTNVSLGVGIVGLAAGAALYLVGRRAESSSRIAVGVGPGAVVVQGVF